MFANYAYNIIFMSCQPISFLLNEVLLLPLDTVYLMQTPTKPQRICSQGIVYTLH